MLRASRDDGVSVDRMSGAELRGEFPALALPELSGGVEGLLERKNAGYLNPRHLVRAQLTLAARYGTRVLNGTVASIRKDGSWRVLMEGAEGRVVLRAAKVLVAAGSLVNHTDALPGPYRLDLQASPSPTCSWRSRTVSSPPSGTCPPS